MKTQKRPLLLAVFSELLFRLLQYNFVCLYACFIRIQDDGPGIASADAARIFLPFVRLETQSSTAPQFGLGLAIVVKVLDWHHARILLESHAPNGASFVIALPLQSKKPA